MSEQTKLDLSKPVQTRDGRPVRVLCADRKGSEHPVMGLVEVCDVESLMTWPLSGRLIGHRLHDSDLINVPPRRVKREGWVNLYLVTGTNMVTTSTMVYGSENEASGMGADDHTYIATIRIEWEEDEQP